MQTDRIDRQPMGIALGRLVGTQNYTFLFHDWHAYVRSDVYYYYSFVFVNSASVYYY